MLELRWYLANVVVAECLEQHPSELLIGQVVR
jgi:hypothetical protein